MSQSNPDPLSGTIVSSIDDGHSPPRYTVATPFLEGLVMNINQIQKSRELVRHRGLQLPKGGSPSHGSKTSRELERYQRLQLPRYGSPTPGSSTTVLTEHDIVNDSERLDYRLSLAE